MEQSPTTPSLRSLLQVPLREENQWNVVAYSLNRDVVPQDNNDLYGVVFCLGSFASRTKAEKWARQIIGTTGYSGVTVVRYGIPLPLQSQPPAEAVEQVPVDTEGKLLQMEEGQARRDRETYEKRAKREQEIAAEAEQETDRDHPEHFKRQAYLAIKNWSRYQHHKVAMEEALADYHKREAAVQDHYERHPEHEAEWLPALKQKLCYREEMQLYQAIAAGYQELRPQLLGIAPKQN